jgi:hypothetical protein
MNRRTLGDWSPGPLQFSFAFQSRSGNDTEPARPVDVSLEECKERPAFQPFWEGVGRRPGRFIRVATVRLGVYSDLEGVGPQLPKSLRGQGELA